MFLASSSIYEMIQKLIDSDIGFKEIVRINPNFTIDGVHLLTFVSSHQVKYLMDNGLDLTLDSTKGVIMNCSTKEELWYGGFDMTYKDNNDNTFLHGPFINDFKKEEMTHNLIKGLIKIIDINAKNKDGETPLHLACKNNNSLVVHILLKLGAIPNMKDIDGKTPEELEPPSDDITCIRLEFARYYKDKQEELKQVTIGDKKYKFKDSKKMELLQKVCESLTSSE